MICDGADAPSEVSRKTPQSPQLNLARFLPYQIAVLASRLSRRTAAIYEKTFNISVAEWRVIAHLAQRKRVSVKDIHNCVNLEKPRVSRAATRLESAEIVQKTINIADRRLVELSLTRKGRRLYEQLVPKANALEDELYSTITNEEREVFNRVLEKLHMHLDQDPLAPPRSRLNDFQDE